MAKKFIIRKGEWGTGCKWSNTNASVNVGFEVAYWDYSYLCVNMIRDRIDTSVCIYTVEEV